MRRKPRGSIESRPVLTRSLASPPGFAPPGVKEVYGNLNSKYSEAEIEEYNKSLKKLIEISENSTK